MAFELASAGRMKAAMETMAHRIRNMKQKTEEALDQATTVAFTNGTAMVAGYVNERYGTPPADDASGYKEMKVMGVPADMVAGGILIGGVMLGAFGKYSHLGLSVGNGASSAFLYRFGAEFARKHAAAAGAPATTSGALGQGGRSASAWEGSRRTVPFAA